MKKAEDERELARARHEMRPPNPTGYFTKTIGAMDVCRRETSGPHQAETETDYFKVRTFKNGNAHLWFTRQDLVLKVNQLLGKYYVEVFGDGQTQEAAPFENKKTTPARYAGFFPKPEAAAHKVLGHAYTKVTKSQERLRILEPSAGTGNRARLCFSRPAKSGYDRDCDLEIYRFDNIVDCIEIQPHLANELKADGRYGRVYCADFMQIEPETTGLFDRIVMNPPFDRLRDIDHVVHALKFLKPNGRLVAIMSAGTEFRSDRKSVEI